MRVQQPSRYEYHCSGAQTLRSVLQGSGQSSIHVRIGSGGAVGASERCQSAKASRSTAPPAFSVVLRRQQDTI